MLLAYFYLGERGVYIYKNEVYMYQNRVYTYRHLYNIMNSKLYYRASTE